MCLSFQIKMNIKEKRVQHQTSWDVGRGGPPTLDNYEGLGFPASLTAALGEALKRNEHVPAYIFFLSFPLADCLV